MKKKPTITLKTPIPPVVIPMTLEQRAVANSKKIWDARLAELKAMRKTAGFVD